MNRSLCLAAAFATSWFLPIHAADQNASDDLRLTLPPTGYAVVGSEMNVYFDNLVLREDSSDLKFTVVSELGHPEKNRWTVTPQDSEIGTHPWQVTVSRGDQQLAQGTLSWLVSPAKVTSDRPVSLLIVGDSLTHATMYPNDLAKRLTASGISHWTMYGSHRPGNAEPGVAHEGYGGWRWQTFVEHFEPNPDPDKTKRKHSSPFVFMEGNQPKLDVGRYLREVCQNMPPDFVIFKLGINDCFGANPHELEKTDQQIDGVFQYAETLIQAFRKSAPKAELGLCLTTPGNSRDAAFVANYQERYPRWGWKRIQHRLVERQLKQFRGRENERIHIIPTELNLDPVAGYPEDNAVHPNETGYKQIAASIHAWLMSRLTAP